MRKLCFPIIILALLLSTTAYADESKIYYKEGTRLEFDDFDIKFNIQLQSRYSYTDVDTEGREEFGFTESGQNSSSFDVHRARLIMSGNALSKEFSYKLQQEFTSNSGQGDLRDAWIQWNGDPAKIKFGQFKQPLGRQERISSSRLFFIDRSSVSNEFTFSRNQGAMAHGSHSEMGAWYFAINNGESSDEGLNQDAEDTDMQGVLAADFSSPGYGSRWTEGDFRNDREFAWTLGGAAAYGEGSTIEDGDFEKIDLNADIGFRFSGTEISGELFYRDTDLKTGSVGDEDNLKDKGFYLGVTHNFNDRIGAGIRYGLAEPDDAFASTIGLDSIEEYSFVLNYYFKGHYLKLQNGFTYEVTDLADSSSLDDFRYDLQLSGYF